MVVFNTYQDQKITFDDLYPNMLIKYHYSTLCEDMVTRGNIYILDINSLKNRFNNLVNTEYYHRFKKIDPHDLQPKPNIGIFWFDNTYSILEFPNNCLKQYEFVINYDLINPIKKRAQTKIIREELIKKTWNPVRITDWCLDLETKKDCF